MTIIDLYTEHYLGQPETTLVEKNSSNQTVFKVRLFSADFSSIVDWIPLNQNSNHESVVYLYNTNLDWGSELTQIIRIQEFYDQLIAITNLVQPHPLGLPDLNSIKQICQSALQNGNRLFIQLNN